MKSNYANRIRRWSTPEKQFEVFASVKKDGQSYMTISDFRDSLLPSDFDEDYHEVREVPEIFKLIDLDGDGLIDYSEYLLFTAFLSIPAHHYELAFKMFDRNGDGNLDQSEFERVMQAVRGFSPYLSKQRTSPFGIDPRSSTKTTDEPKVISSGLLVAFFGEDGQRTLSIVEFKEFMSQFMLAILELEFGRFDPTNTGFISARDFGLAIAGYANPSQIASFFERLEKLRQDPRKVSWQDFVNYQLAMQQIPEIVSALRLYTFDGEPFSKQDFAHAITSVTGLRLSDVQLDTIFFLFDEDQSGSFNIAEVASIFQSRASRNLAKKREIGFWDSVSCCRQCFSS